MHCPAGGIDKVSHRQLGSSRISEFDIDLKTRHWHAQAYVIFSFFNLTLPAEWQLDETQYNMTCGHTVTSTQLRYNF